MGLAAKNDPFHRAEVDACRHCGQALLTHREKESGFCCAGCKAVFEFIGGLGLDYFYCLRARGPEWNLTPVAKVKSTYTYFDDARFAEKFISTEIGGLQQIRFHLSGLHCAACLWLLEKLPEILPGLAKVRVDLIRSKAQVVFDPKMLRPSAVGHTFAALGYAPHPISVDGRASAPEKIDRTFALQLGLAAFSSMNIMVLFIGRYQGLFSGMEERYAHFFAWVSLVLTIPVVTFSALPFYRTSWAGLRLGRVHIDLPIAVAIVSGFIGGAVNTFLGRTEIYFDTVTALVFLLLVGRWFQRRAMKQVANASELLYTMMPLEAVRKGVDGAREEIFVDSLNPGDETYVGHDERFSCDGEVLAGESYANNALLTGESRPVPLRPGALVWAGTKNIGPEITVRISQVGESTRLGRLMSEIQLTPARESKTARFTDRVGVYFVFGVFGLAIATFIGWYGQGFWVAWDRVIALLIVSCPCALGIATPVTLSLASAQAARRGILLKSGDALERLAAASHVLFDKTGTLTTGKLGLRRAVLSDDGSQWLEIWGTVLGLEEGIGHPAAEALSEAAVMRQTIARKFLGRAVVPGAGVTATDADGRVFRIGSLRWLSENGAEVPPLLRNFIEEALIEGFSVIGLSHGESITGLFALGDSLRPEAADTVLKLFSRGLKVGMLSGDMVEVTTATAEVLGIAAHNAEGGLSPEAKATVMRGLGDAGVLVGDGINDALALASAGVGIGVSGGAEVCLKVADVFLIRPDLSLIVTAIDGARRTLRLIHRHLAVSLFYNLAAASLAISGYIGPLGAALVMPASSLTVILSSLFGAPFKRTEP